MAPALTNIVSIGLALIAVDATLLPIILMHGIDDNHREFDSMLGWIRAIDPNVTLYSVPICDDTASYTNLWTQGDEIIGKIREQISASPTVYKNGYTLLCHSQGALTCRTVVQRMDDHNVHTFISLAGPQMGEFGIPSGWQAKIPWGRDLAYPFMFSKTLQSSLSIANFWNDPRPTSNIFGRPETDYHLANTFLPVLHNDPARRTQGPGKERNDTEAARYKMNFLRLQRAVFTCGTADNMIIPYDSGIWNFYDEKAQRIIPLEQTLMWSDDWLGLRQLSESGRLVRTNASGVCHTCWTHDQTVFAKYIAPHLPAAPEVTVVV